MPLSQFIHNANISMKRFRLKELREEFLEFLSFFVGVSLSRRGEDFIDGRRPPSSNKFILVGEEELVADRTAENGSRNAEDGGFEDVGVILFHTIKDKLLWLAFPAGV